MNTSRESGATLILSVMLLAAITVLVGLGRLAMFRSQARLRLDREREIQQEFATRSALRWLETLKDGQALPSEDVPFVFPTLRGDMGVVLRPAEPVFPRKGVSGDFDLSKSGRNDIPFGGYVGGSSLLGQPESADDGTYCQLRMADENSTVGETRTLFVDIAKTRVDTLWTDSDFGLRYLVTVTHFCEQTPGSSASDLLRFSMTPFGTLLESEGGSGSSPYAMWMEQQIPEDWPNTGDRAQLSLWVRAPGLDGDPNHLGGQKMAVAEVKADKPKGFQLASTKASLVQQFIAHNDPDAIRSTRTYSTFDLDAKMWAGFTKEFTEQFKEGVRLTVQVVVRRPRPEPEAGEEGGTEVSISETEQESFWTSISKIAVTPAYEYTTDIDWRERDGSRTEEVSTVVRCDPAIHGEGNDGLPVSTVTYDTHGTYANRKNHLGNLTR